ncbi:MAG: hypothetical protein ABSC18_16930, partial [Verrucomicrobiota bacterium]
MAWIKRNLFFLLSLVAGLVLTGYCGYLFSGDLKQNAVVNTEFQGYVTQYNALQKKPVYPSDEHIQQAKAELGQVTEFEDQVNKAFSPYTPHPKEDEKGFSEYLENTIAELKTQATNASVALPDTMAFGFTDQRGKLRYPLENIEPWMQQLTEIKALCNILFGAKINSLAMFRRVALSPTNDLILNPDDTFPASKVTTSAETKTPYKIEFRCFSRELAAVLNGLAQSGNCFIVKNVVVSPADVKSLGQNPPAAAPEAVASAPAPPTPPPASRRPDATR